MVTCIGIALQKSQASVIESLDIPGGIGKKAVEARRVRGLGEFAIDSRDVLAFGDEQAGEVFGEVAALRFVGEQRAEDLHGFLNDLREFDDGWHGLHSRIDIGTALSDLCTAVTHSLAPVQTLCKTSATLSPPPLSPLPWRAGCWSG